MAVNIFYARLDNCSEFRKLLESIKDLVPNVNLNITNQGISFESNESLHVVQVKLRIPVSYFSEYKCNGSFNVGVSLKDFYTLMKLGQPEDSLILQYMDNATVLQVSLEAPKIPKICEFSLNLIAVSENDCVYVEVQNSGRFEMNSKELYQTCNDLSCVSEFLKISVNKMRVKFSVHTDLGQGSINLKQLRGQNGMHIQTPKTINTEINLIYAKKITKAYILTDRVEVRLYPEEPIIFYYNFSGAELKFYLAPAISD